MDDVGVMWWMAPESRHHSPADEPSSEVGPDSDSVDIPVVTESATNAWLFLSGHALAWCPKHAQIWHKPVNCIVAGVGRSGGVVPLALDLSSVRSPTEYVLSSDRFPSVRYPFPLLSRLFPRPLSRPDSPERGVSLLAYNATGVSGG